jgi:hypothetical protein
MESLKYTEQQPHSLEAVSVLPTFTPALQTRTGAFLKYDYTYIKLKDGIKKTYMLATDRFKQALLETNKEKLPRIDLRAGTISGVFADFDDLKGTIAVIPAAFGAKTWADVRRYFSCFFWNGCIFKSFSGRAKIFFPVSIPKLTTTKSEKILEELLGQYMRALNIDTDKSGLRYSFINKESYPILSAWLLSSDFDTALQYNNMICKKYISAGMETGKQYGGEGRDIGITSYPIKSDYKWRINNEVEIPENMLNNLKTKNKNISGLIRYALGSSFCVSSGVAIPVDLLATALNITKPSASRLIRNGINLGIIKKVSEYIPHVKAASYCFTGFWCSWAKQVIKTAPRASTTGIKTILDTIKDGNWNMPLFKLTNFFDLEEKYMAFVLTIPNIHAKTEREKQAKNAWKSHLKRDINKNIKKVA